MNADDGACRFCHHALVAHNNMVGCSNCRCLATRGEARPQSDAEMDRRPLPPTGCLPAFAPPAPPAAASRSYTVGLPVVVTVSDDGVVTYEVDTSEASAGIAEAWGEDPGDDDEARMLLDCAIVDAQRAHTAAPSVVRHARLGLPSLACPAGYPCTEVAASIDAMAVHLAEAHIEEPDATPCCPDPGCPGRGAAACTFPGYADNH